MLQTISNFFVKILSSEKDDFVLLEVSDKKGCGPDLEGTVHAKEIWICWFGDDMRKNPRMGPGPRRDHEKLLRNHFRDFNRRLERNRKSWEVYLSLPAPGCQPEYSCQDKAMQDDSSETSDSE